MDGGALSPESPYVAAKPKPKVKSLEAKFGAVKDQTVQTRSTFWFYVREFVINFSGAKKLRPS
jgi:hypothetical protein